MCQRGVVRHRCLNIWSCSVKNLVHWEKTGSASAGKAVRMRLGANTRHHILGLQLPSWWSRGKLNSRRVDDSNWGSIYDGGGEPKKKKKKSPDLSVGTHLMLRHRLQKLSGLARRAVTLSGFAQYAAIVKRLSKHSRRRLKANRKTNSSDRWSSPHGFRAPGMKAEKPEAR